MHPVVSQICLDAADPLGLARWWAEVLGWTVRPDGDDEVTLVPPSGSGTTEWVFLRVGDARVVKNRLHPDLRPPDGSDQPTELARLLELGARPVDVGQGPEATWHVLADPEGNEFCLLRSTPSGLADHLAARAALTGG